MYTAPGVAMETGGCSVHCTAGAPMETGGCSVHRTGAPIETRSLIVIRARFVMFIEDFMPHLFLLCRIIDRWNS